MLSHPKGMTLFYSIIPFFIVNILSYFLFPCSIRAQVFRGYYSNGAVKFKVKKDKKREIIRGYYPSGSLEFIASYKKGELDGITREYYENGILKAEIPYKDNTRHGLAKFYYENGMLMGKILYKKNRETGKAKFYDENGLLISSTPRQRRRTQRIKRYERGRDSSTDSIKTKD